MVAAYVAGVLRETSPLPLRLPRHVRLARAAGPQTETTFCASATSLTLGARSKLSHFESYWALDSDRPSELHRCDPHQRDAGRDVSGPLDHWTTDLTNCRGDRTVSFLGSARRGSARLLRHRRIVATT